MKKALLLLLTLLMLIGIASCQKKEYFNDKDPDDIIEKVITAMPNGTQYLEADDDYLDIYLPEGDLIRDHEIYYAKDGNNIDEFGVFHVSDGDITSIEAHLKQYLSQSYEQNQAFYDSYIPQETPKLKNAEVRRFGNYVAYAILDDSAREIFFKAVEQELKR